ncbi:MAG: hypothetical protein AAFZ80_11255, partial [Cyanobacteria bacterium P01_A01_bin.105]
SVGLGLFLLLVFAVLQWFQVPTGSALDWVIGGASFWWLAVIVTFPWDIHFQARRVLAEMGKSREREIAVGAEPQSYVQNLARRSLGVAIALHLLSTLGLYSLAALGISQLGYLSSGAALLLTGLRPAIEAYRYWGTRLTTIRQDIIYPREDIVTVRAQLNQLASQLKGIEQQLDPERDESWTAQYRRFTHTTRRQLADQLTALEKLSADNQSDHDRLSREAQQAISQLSSDSQFLEHVREIIRFFKAA